MSGFTEWYWVIELNHTKYQPSSAVNSCSLTQWLAWDSIGLKIAPPSSLCLHTIDGQKHAPVKIDNPLWKKMILPISTGRGILSSTVSVSHSSWCNFHCHPRFQKNINFQNFPLLSVQPRCLSFPDADPAQTVPLNLKGRKWNRRWLKHD